MSDREKSLLLLSTIGMQVRMPNRMFCIIPCHDLNTLKISWAERTRNKLVFKLRKRIALRNLIFKITLWIGTFPIPFMLAYKIAYFIVVTIKYKNGVLTGILLAEFIIICFIVLFELISLINHDSERVIINRRFKRK